MSELQLANGQQVYYEYDGVQDMLYVLFQTNVGPTYYQDLPDSPGVMLRHDVATDKVVGLTVHNVQLKLMQKLITDLGDQVLPKAA